MKLVRMLILALGVVTLATAASFAAVPFNTTATVNMMNVDAQTGQIGSILYTPMTAGFVAAGEIISLNLPANVPISYLPDITVSLTGSINTTGFKETFGNAVTGFTRIGSTTFVNYGDTMTAGTSGATISGVSVQANQYALVISFGASINFATSDFIKIDGVRVDATSMAVAGNNLQISLTNVAGQATTDTPQLYVAAFTNQIMQLTGVSGMGNSGVVATGGQLYFSANGQPYDSGNGSRNLVTVTLRELFPNAWETKNNTSFQTWANTKIRIALTIPAELPVTVAGVTLAGPDGATFTNGQLMGGAITVNPLAAGVLSQASNKLESLQVGIRFNVISGQILPLTSSPITFTAYLDPPAASALPYNLQQYYGAQLKYKDPVIKVQGSIPVNFVPLTSNLLSLYNSLTRLPSGVMIYDTGFSVSNLSGSNPKTLSTYPAGSPGVIAVSFYPMDGSGPLTMNTSQLSDALKTQSGLDSAGALKSKGTFVILLSQLLEVAGYSPTSSFSGFIRFQCNFTESTGVAVIGDPKFEKYTVGFPMVSDTPTNQNLNISINVPSGGGAATGTATGTVVPPLF